MNRVFLGLVGVFLLVLYTPLAAAPGDWATQKTGDGLATVKSRMSHQPGPGGKSLLLLESVTTTTAPGDLRRYVSLMKDLGRHKDFLETTESTVVRALSDGRSVIYYRFNVPWPLPGSDLVATMEFQEVSPKSAQFTVTAAPDLAPAKEGASRMVVYDLRYLFTDVGNGNVEVTVSSRAAPAMDVPEWMLRGYYPEGPTDVVRKLIKAAQK